jgi:hypothetical protein
LGVYLRFQFLLLHGFHRSDRTYGHENRGLYHAMVGCDFACAGFAFGVGV